jgi:predicted nucleotide-binding protein
LNPEILALYGVPLPLNNRDYRHVQRMTKYGALIGRERIIFPGSYLFEVPGIDRVLQGMSAAIRAGVVYVATPADKLSRYAEKKRREYRDEPDLLERYSQSSSVELGSQLRPAPRLLRSSSTEIAGAWYEELADGGILHEALRNAPLRGMPATKLESKLASVPTRLDGRAFVTRFALPLISFPLEVQDETKIGFLISRVYLQSYLDEYQAFILTDTPLGHLDCAINPVSLTGRTQKISYAVFQQMFAHLGIAPYFENVMGWAQLLEFRAKPILDWFVRLTISNAENMRSAIRAAVLHNSSTRRASMVRLAGNDALHEMEARLYYLRDIVLAGQFDHVDTWQPTKSVGAQVNLFAAPGEAQKGTTMIRTTDVFIVHGRDAKVVASIKTLLRAAALNPLDWEEVVSWTGSASPATLDVIKTGLERAQAVVVLLTPDEEVKLREDLRSAKDSEHGYQVRPNVLIELGMAFAMAPNRTLLLKLGSLRSISDISGLNFLSFSGDAASRNSLAERLKVAGCTLRPSAEFFSMDISLPTA